MHIAKALYLRGEKSLSYLLSSSLVVLLDELESEEGGMVYDL